MAAANTCPSVGSWQNAIVATSKACSRCLLCLARAFCARRCRRLRSSATRANSAASSCMATRAPRCQRQNLLETLCCPHERGHGFHPNTNAAGQSTFPKARPDRICCGCLVKHELAGNTLRLGTSATGSHDGRVCGDTSRTQAYLTGSNHPQTHGHGIRVRVRRQQYVNETAC